MIDVCKELREAAEAAGIKPEPIAVKLGVSFDTARRLLRGEVEPRGKQFLTLIDVVPGFGERVGVERVSTD